MATKITDEVFENDSLFAEDSDVDKMFLTEIILYYEGSGYFTKKYNFKKKKAEKKSSRTIEHCN